MERHNQPRLPLPPGPCRSFRSQRPPARTAARLSTALPGAVNQGAFNPTTWKYGDAFNAPANSKIWNPVKLKMMKGDKVTGGTVFNTTDPAVYCAMANAGYDFIWTEMQHDPKDWSTVAKMWATCPNAKAVPGTRVAYTDEKEIQHAVDSGALVLVVPTVDTVEEATPRATGPTSRRSAGAATAAAWRSAQHVGRRAWRLPPDDQRQHRADSDDRDPRGPEER